MEGLQDKYNNSPKEENKWQKETDLEPIRSNIWQIGIPEREKKVNRKEEMIKKKHNTIVLSRIKEHVFPILMGSPVEYPTTKKEKRPLWHIIKKF